VGARTKELQGALALVEALLHVALAAEPVLNIVRPPHEVLCVSEFEAKRPH
jgi:hypothetical protein